MTANPARLLCELIALPSVNPALLPEGDRRVGERRVAEFLAATAAKAGLDVDLQEVLPGRCNLVAVLGAAHKPSRRVLLAPHMDTVGVASDQQLNRRASRKQIPISKALFIICLGTGAINLVTTIKQRPK